MKDNSHYHHHHKEIIYPISPLGPYTFLVKSLCLDNKFVMISNVDIKNETHKMLFNLFGCFGNVPRLLIQEKPSLAVLEYETECQANVVIKYIDCIMLCGKTINVCMYNGPDLFNKINKKKDILSQIYINKPTSYRFTFQSIDQLITPSRILCISGFSILSTAKTLETLIG